MVAEAAGAAADSQQRQWQRPVYADSLLPAAAALSSALPHLKHAHVVGDGAHQNRNLVLLRGQGSGVRRAHGAGRDRPARRSLRPFPCHRQPLLLPAPVALGLQQHGGGAAPCPS